VIVEALAPASFDEAIPGLAALVVDAVRGGASLNFLADVTADTAAAWWERRRDVVGDGTATVFVARNGDTDTILGSTLLLRSTNANSPHRAEIGKVVVHRSVRRQGIARALMAAAEERARSDSRWLLVLDTVSGSPAEAFYRALGWHETGVVPNYALLPDGRPWPATFFWKDLRA
jgi:GNAT superfamily N-acetyltransferase